MKELLSPAGTLESFYAAISNGANAVYLGLDKFSARAYATNFKLDSFKEIINYAHLRNVKIYVTINTIIYDDELEEVYKTIDKLAEYGCDAIIVQDLAIFHYIVNKYKSLEAHASTQMGIDDVEGAKLIKELGSTRIVPASETPIETLKEIKEKLGIEIEAFIHGALCVCYSGNCLMSSMIGDRSGNRGRCAGTCRRIYSLINKDTNNVINKSYLLSMKDLNTSEFVKNYDFIDSFKIEGRMKEPNYVAGVTRLYREIIDNKEVNKEDFNKTFNRTYTKGFLNNESANNITNIEKPNNYGYLIGSVIKQDKNKIYIKLDKTLNKGDQIRIETSSIFSEISIPVLKMFDFKNNEVITSNKEAIIYSDNQVKIGAKVYKTKDINFFNEANKSITNKIYNPILVDMKFSAHLNKPLKLELLFNDKIFSTYSNFNVEKAEKTPTTKENVLNQLSKLNDTVYKLNKLDFDMDDNLFIPLKSINELRRVVIEELNKYRLHRDVILNKPKEIVPKKYDLHTPIITVEVNTEEQYNFVKSLGIEHIYYKNIVNRNNAKYLNYDEEVLVGGLGGLSHYKNKNLVITDYSFNVVNYETVALLSSLGADRVTLSEEINKDNINKLVNNYFNKYNTYPNLELKIYGRTKLMHTKYCPLKRLNKCGECKKNNYVLKDEFNYEFPLKFNNDCTIFIYNNKILNLIDEINNIKGINYFRLSFLDETNKEIERLINATKEALTLNRSIKTFNKNKQTHGHFFEKPL